MHALVFPSDTCWLIESIRLSLFISFSWDWDSLLSPAGRLRHNGSTGFGLTGLHLIFRIRALHLTQTPPGLLAVLFVLTCVLREGKKEKKAQLVFLLHGGQETQGLVEANRMQMLVVWEKERRKRHKQMKGWGDNKLFANQATMSAIALLEWMQQAWVFQPDYWSMWTHIFPAMGEETVMTKPMPFPLIFFSFTVLFCSSSMSLSHPVLISVLFVLPLRFSFFISLLLYITQGDIISPVFQNGKKSIWVICSQGWLSELGMCATFQGNSNWKANLWRYDK